MGVALYIFTPLQAVRRVVLAGVEELTHDEGEGKLTAVIPASTGAAVGEYLGFDDRDGRFRLFLITDAEKDDARGALEIDATDAARAELEATITQTRAITQTGATAAAAAQAVLAGSAWSIGQSADGVQTSDFEWYYTTIADALDDIADKCGVWITPYYTISGGQITARTVDVISTTPVFRGKIFMAQTDTDQIYITQRERPMVRAYALGATTGTTTPAARVTITDATWSTAAGNPADKPAGQDWIDNPAAAAKYGDGATHAYTYTNEGITDPTALLEAAWRDLLTKAAPKISGTARARIIQPADGQTVRAVHVYDQVALAQRDGQTIMAQVLAIKWHYVREAETEIVLGSRDDDPRKRTLKSEIRSLFTATQANANRGRANSNGIAENGDLIELNAKQIKLNGEQIELRATYEELVEVENETTDKFNEVSITLDAQQAAIDLKASQKEVTKISERVKTAEINIDAANAAIELRAKIETTDAMQNQINSAFVEIDAANAQIKLKANQTTVDNISSQVQTNTAELSVQAGQISTKVSANGVISAINQTAEAIQIKASKIDLDGYVTASQLEALSASFDSLISGNLQATLINTRSLTCSGMFYDGYTALWKSQTLYNITLQKTTKTIITGDGDSVTVVTNAWLSKDSFSIRYLGRS